MYQTGKQSEMQCIEVVPIHQVRVDVNTNLPLGVTSPCIHFLRGGEGQCVFRSHCNVLNENAQKARNQLRTIVISSSTLR